jgi:hypothetical protein
LAKKIVNNVQFPRKWVACYTAGKAINGSDFLDGNGEVLSHGLKVFMSFALAAYAQSLNLILTMIS